MGFKWLQDPELQILALYLRREVGLGRGGWIVGTQTKFLAVVTSFELPDQQWAAAFCIMPSLLAKHLQTWPES